MAEKLREFIDKDHKVMGLYYDICEKYNGRNAKSAKKNLKKLIDEDPDFLDSSLLLHDILQDEGSLPEAEKILDDAFERALATITDKKGSWPDMLEWGWLENRHIIRTLLNKALSFWRKGENENALDLLRKLLRTNPGDNIGAREFILAIRMNMTLDGFESRFDRGGYYDNELMDWFDENYKKFPDEFDWWDKAMEKYR